MTDQRWVLTLQDPDDPYRFSVRARQLSTSRWDVDYLRGDEVVSTGGISTPPPHEPPFTTLANTLRELREEADRFGHDWLRPLDRIATEVLAESPQFLQERVGQWTPRENPDDKEPRP